MRLLLVLSALVAAGGLAVGQEESVDNEGIRSLTARFSAAWAQHDAQGLADLWVGDGDLVNPMGRTARGRAELVQFFRDEHGSYMKGTTLTVKVTATRPLGPGLALVDCEAQLAKAEAGKSLPALKHLIYAVVAKSGDQWRFVSARLSVPVPPPLDTGAQEVSERGAAS